jgi:glycosyltransferase involved in cell wall biosynthesis
VQSARIEAMFDGASRILVLGNVWRTFVASRAPGASDRIEILPNASRAPQSPAKLAGDAVTILFLGQVGQRKGIPQLLDALGVIRDLPNWCGIIAGNGAVDEARARATALELGERVQFTGWIGPEKVNDLLATSHILVLPSFDENLPMSVIEGMSYGLAVVTTPVGAVEDIVQDGTTGLLVPPGDAQRLAHALRRLILDPPLRAALGRQARQYHQQKLDIGPYVRRLCSIWSAGARHY